MSSLEQNGNERIVSGVKNPTVPICRTLKDFDILDKLGEGTFGLVFKARERSTGDILALKKIRMEKETQGFPLTALREIKILKYIKNENIVDLVDVITGDGDDIYLVFEFIDHDLSGLFNQKPREILKPDIIKSYIKQLLVGLNYLHVNRQILHRDIKTSNLLVSNKGILKLADFGLSRGIIKKEDGEQAKYTPDMITLWYRPPELLLKMYVSYSTEVDMWSVGCVLAELLCKTPLFPGKNELDQLDLILKMCGYPDEETIKVVEGYKDVKPVEQYKSRLSEEMTKLIKDPIAVDLIEKLLDLNPKKRLTAHDALDHDYFWSDPLPCEPENIPYLGESCHEFTSKKKREKMKQMKASNMTQRDFRKHPYQQYPNQRHQGYPMNNQHNVNMNRNYQQRNPNYPQQSMSANYQKAQPKKGSNYQSYFR